MKKNYFWTKLLLITLTTVGISFGAQALDTTYQQQPNEAQNALREIPNKRFYIQDDATGEISAYEIGTASEPVLHKNLMVKPYKLGNSIIQNQYFTDTIPSVAILHYTKNSNISSIKEQSSLDIPIITMTAPPQNDASIELEFGVYSTTTISIDWGDGVISDPINIINWASISGIPKGEGEIKIYGIADDFIFFRKRYTQNNILLTELNISPLTNLQYLDASTNSLTSLDLSKNINLNSLLLIFSKLSELDVSTLTNVTEIYLGYDNISTIDVSKNINLKNLIMPNSKLTALDISNNTHLKLLDISNNPIYFYDVKFYDKANIQSLYIGSTGITGNFETSEFPNLTTLYLNSNAITSINISNSKIERLVLYDNNFTFETLPLHNSAIEYYYAPQKPLDITATNNIVDISSQLKVKDEKGTDVISTYVWKFYYSGIALVSGTDYTEKDGVFTFLKSFDDIYCEISNTLFPQFSGDSYYLFKTNLLDVKVQEEYPEKLYVLGQIHEDAEQQWRSDDQ